MFDSETFNQNSLLKKAAYHNMPTTAKGYWIINGTPANPYGLIP